MYKLVNFCEFDKYAVKSYCSVHEVDESKNLGDITKVDETKLEEFNMICGGSPCQDFSIAGKQEGSKWMCNQCGETYNPLTVHYSKRHQCPTCQSEDLDKSRSSLLVEWLRVIRANKPNWGIYENVKNITGKKFKETFDMFINELNEYGYNCHWKVLNAKDYGIPQNRERVYLFLVKKEIDNGKFEFPKPFDSGKRLKDILEDEVDEKYYINRPWHFSTEKDEKHDTNEIAQFENTIYKATRTIGDTNKICRCLDTMGGGQREPKILVVANELIKHEQESRIYSREGISPCLAARDSQGAKKILEEKIVCEQRTDEGLRFFKGDACGDKRVIETKNYRVRKLTPTECWRLMGFEDSDIEKAKSVGISNSQLYKQAGNSIVTNVLFEIYKEIYKVMPYLFDDLKVSSYFSGIGAFEKALDMLFNYIKNEGEEECLN